MRINKTLNLWAFKHYLNLAVFNFILFLLLIFGINVKTVVPLAFVLAIIILGARSGAMFLIALLFWLGSALQGTAVYTFQALILGTILLIYETARLKK